MLSQVGQEYGGQNLAERMVGPMTGDDDIVVVCELSQDFEQPSAFGIIEAARGFIDQHDITRHAERQAQCAPLSFAGRHIGRPPRGIWRNVEQLRGFLYIAVHAVHPVEMRLYGQFVEQKAVIEK